MKRFTVKWETRGHGRGGKVKTDDQGKRHLKKKTYRNLALYIL